MRPIVEGLLERGHDVTFLLPNTTDARGYFPNGISAGNRSAALLFLGQTDWSFDDLFAGDVRPIAGLPLHLLLTPARHSAGH